MKGSQPPKVYVIHENAEWVVPLRDAFENQRIPYSEWHLDTGYFDLDRAPPPGVFYNRMSASSHTRDHRYAVELAGPVLAWLEAHGRRVINGRRALQLEVRKAEQYISLNQFGIRTPKTAFAVGKQYITAAAAAFNYPLILKPNRGGKGLGVLLIESKHALQRTIHDLDFFEYTLDGVVLVQEYIKPADGHIVRMEFIGGKFYYAVRVDSSDGFELCPADECGPGQIQSGSAGSINNSKPHKGTAPTMGNKAPCGVGSKFEIIEDFWVPEIVLCEKFLAENDIEIAGIEFVENDAGERFIYDVNTNTNYNADAQVRSGKYDGMGRVAEFLGAELNGMNGVKGMNGMNGANGVNEMNGQRRPHFM